MLNDEAGPNKEEDREMHVCLRLPPVVRVKGKSISPIVAHNAVFHEHGHAAVAKFGHPGIPERARTLQHQIEKGVVTLLVLITKKDGLFIGHQSTLSLVHYGMPTSEITQFAPSYYAALPPPKLWFMTSSPFSKTSLDNFELASNNRPLLQVIGECRTSSMLVALRDRLAGILPGQ